MVQEGSYRTQLHALAHSFRYNPKLVSAAVGLSLLAAMLEGFGLSFILPIVELAQGDVDPEAATGLLGLFVEIYAILGLPFSLGWLIIGITIVLTVRYTISFLVGWLRGTITTFYVRHLQREAFERAMSAEVAYFDKQGSDDILNAIVTQAEYAGGVIEYFMKVLEKALLAGVYLLVALILAPLLTLATVIAFLGVTYFFRNVLMSAYSIGDQVADANERIQQYAQAGTQGIREVKLFGLTGELVEKFHRSLDQFATAEVKYYRNNELLGNYYNLATAMMVFVLIYAGLTFSDMTLGELGIFLFAMFRLGPEVSKLNQLVYKLEAGLPHLVRTQNFVDELEQQQEKKGGNRRVPDSIDRIRFDDVSFAYGEEHEGVLQGVTFDLERGEFAAFVGQSGAGKSTIVSLLTRLYDPDDGHITANGIPIQEFDVTQWRSRVAVVRQQPHMFNGTLWENVTIGKRDATPGEVERACELSQVTEFLDELPNGYDSVLGDDGVRLSGGQRQRVAIARALLKDADLLLLDEATSDLDTRLEERVHQAIEGLDQDYAVLVIAHRLSTVTGADRIYAMEGGQIVERGDHRELLNSGGTYSDLYSLQMEA